jgi:hypothetical protein
MFDRLSQNTVVFWTMLNMSVLLWRWSHIDRRTVTENEHELYDGTLRKYGGSPTSKRIPKARKGFPKRSGKNSLSRA